MTSLSNQLNNCLSKKGKEENNVPLSLSDASGTAEEGFKVSLSDFTFVIVALVWLTIVCVFFILLNDDFRHLA